MEKEQAKIPSVMQLITDWEEGRNGSLGLDWHRKSHNGRIDLDWIFYGDKIVLSRRFVAELENSLFELQIKGDLSETESLIERIEYWQEMDTQLSIKRERNLKYYNEINAIDLEEQRKIPNSVLEFIKNKN